VIASPAVRLRRAGCRLIFGREMDAANAAHWATQWASPRRVEGDQWDQVRECVTDARQASPFYQARLDGLGVDQDLTRDAFRRIPPLSRQDVISSWTAIRSRHGGTGALGRRSGGSSGQSVVIPMDRATYCWYVAGTRRGLQWWGVDLTDRGAIILGAGAGGLRSLAVRAKDSVLNWLRQPVDERFDQRAPDVLDRLERFGPAFVYGYPSAVHRLARVIDGRPWRPKRPTKVIVLTGEPVYPYQRRGIERAFHCPVVEEYGNGELGSMAFQCTEGALHITVENVFLESVPLEPPVGGTGGRVLATQLRNRLFPLIRYETGDVGVVGAEPCRCGRGLPTIQVLGRTEEVLMGSDGAALARPSVERFLGAVPRSLQGRVQVVHPAPGRLVLRIERDRDLREDLREPTAVAEGVFGRGWQIEAAAVDRLPRLRSGKLPYFLRTAAP